jgi:hypothetical protein
MTIEKPSGKNTPLRTWLIMTNIGMLAFFITSSIVGSEDPESVANMIAAMFWFGCVIASFVLSIIHLTRYKEKGFAVTSLVINSIFVFIGVLSFMVGFLSVL